MSSNRTMLSPLWLIQNGSATGGAQKWPGGQGAFLSEHAAGTVTLEFNLPNPDTNVWAAVGTNTTLAASGGGLFYLPPGTLIRAAVSGATGVYCYVRQVE